MPAVRLRKQGATLIFYYKSREQGLLGSTGSCAGQHHGRGKPRPKPDTVYYDLLGVKRDATDREMRRQFKKLALKHHPDRNTGVPAPSHAWNHWNLPTHTWTLPVTGGPPGLLPRCSHFDRARPRPTPAWLCRLSVPDHSPLPLPRRASARYNRSQRRGTL